MLHRYSTLAAAIAAIVIGALIGAATRWSVIAIVLSVVVAFLVLPRAFFGLKASRAVDKEHYDEDTGPTFLVGRDMAGLASESQQLDRAYSRATDHFDSGGRPPDPTDFRKLAEEEEASERH